MKTNFGKLSVSLTCLILLYGLGGCVTSPTPSSTNPTETKIVTVNSAMSTRIPSATSTFTQTPTLVPPTPTIIPTLNVETASEEILRLLSSVDDSCLFPCWWGLIPEQTRILDAQNYLTGFGVLPGGGPKFETDEGYISFQVPQSSSSYLDITFEFEGKDGILSWLQVDIQRRIKVTYSGGESGYEISWNDPALAEVIKQYSLQNILSTYGEPSDILVFTRQTGLLNRALPVSIVLFYPQHGFMIEYVTDGQIISDNIIGCPSLAFPNFWFWSPSEQITMDDVVSTIGGYQIGYESIVNFKTIQDATGMNIDEFYSSFKVDKNKCIETAQNIWPLPGQ